MEETKLQMKVTGRQLKELGKQIGGLGQKFGSFAEGLSYASIEKILREDFDLNEFVTPAVKMRKGGREEEYDVLAYSNGEINKGMIVEIKSRLRQEDIDQMKRKMDEVFYWLPEHKNKKFYGMIAYVSGHTDLKRQIIENGWYLDAIYKKVFVALAQGVAGLLFGVENKGFDGTSDGIANGTVASAGVASKSQSGHLQIYIGIAVAGVAIACLVLGVGA